MTSHRPIILAADKLSFEDVRALAEKVGTRVGAIKIHTLYDEHGPYAAHLLRSMGVPVWVDHKLHDIPETVASRAKALADAGANIITVHASGGVEMMRAAVEAAPQAQVFAVTVLTSIAEADARALFGTSIREAVRERALLAAKAGVDGIVCSAEEVALLANEPKLRDLRFVVPGIRSAGKDTHDQKRVGTPRATLLAGATDLVIGRQITLAADPVAALAEIEAEIAGLGTA